MTSEWRHDFPIQDRNKGLRETPSRKQFKRKTRLVFNKRLRMKVFITLLSWIFKTLKIWLFLENIPQEILLKKNEEDFADFSKNGISVTELCQVYACTKFQVDILNNDRVLLFWRSKQPFFSLVPAFSVFFRFSKFVRFWPFRKFSRVIFRVLDEKLTRKHVSRCPNPKFSVWTFLDLVTLNDLEFTHRKPRMTFRRVTDTIHVVVLAYFPFPAALVRDKSRFSKSSNILSLTWPVTSSVTNRG